MKEIVAEKHIASERKHKTSAAKKKTTKKLDQRDVHDEPKLMREMPMFLLMFCLCLFFLSKWAKTMQRCS